MFRDKCNRYALALAAAGLAGGLPSYVQAAVITFGTATNIAGVSDVNTTGTLDRAFNLGTTATTVNGVNFADVSTGGGASSLTAGNTTFDVGTGNTLTLNTTDAKNGTTVTSYNNLDASYQKLLLSSVNGPNSASKPTATNPVSATAISVTLNGLTVGNQYLLQLFLNDSHGNPGGARTDSISGGGSSVTLAFNTSAADGGLGQYVIGTFTASAASQLFTITGSSAANSGNYASSQLNGLQLRAIPEPASLAVLSLGGMLALRRRP